MDIVDVSVTVVVVAAAVATTAAAAAIATAAAVVVILISRIRASVFVYRTPNLPLLSNHIPKITYNHQNSNQFVRILIGCEIFLFSFQVVWRRNNKN